MFHRMVDKSYTIRAQVVVEVVAAGDVFAQTQMMQQDGFSDLIYDHYMGMAHQ